MQSSQLIIESTVSFFLPNFSLYFAYDIGLVHLFQGQVFNSQSQIPSFMKIYKVVMKTKYVTL